MSRVRVGPYVPAVLTTDVEPNMNEYPLTVQRGPSCLLYSTVKNEIGLQENTRDQGSLSELRRQ